jgi:hypothetical protein
MKFPNSVSGVSNLLTRIEPSYSHLFSVTDPTIITQFIQLFLSVLYHRPEDDPRRSKYDVELKDITFTGCVNGNLFLRYKYYKKHKSP